MKELLHYIVWGTCHAKDYTLNYKWGTFFKEMPKALARPLTRWNFWALMVFGLVCSAYIPYFWLVFALILGFFLLLTIVTISSHLPHSLYGMVTRIYQVKYEDGTTHFVRMEIPRWACQHKSDPYGVYQYTLPELRRNTKIKFWMDVNPFEHSLHRH